MLRYCFTHFSKIEPKPLSAISPSAGIMIMGDTSPLHRCNVITLEVRGQPSQFCHIYQYSAIRTNGGPTLSTLPQLGENIVHLINIHGIRVVK
jgi:hypothetical protein